MASKIFQIVGRWGDMADSGNFVERRAHERYKVKDGIVAIPHASSTRFGRIRDISMGGLTVRYFEEEELQGKSYEIDLVMADGNFSLDRVLINIKFDMENSTETPFCTLPERRCGLQFVDLTDHQYAKLRTFVDQQAASHDMIEYEWPLTFPQYMAG
jgi:c-di-GMP-binding flagellar brake protein YcgR